MTKTSVTFNAPASAPPSDVVVTITATSVTDATRNSPATVTVAAIAVSISSNLQVTVPANTTQDFTATVSYDPGNAGVTWSLSPATGVGSLSKATSTSVTYSAPANMPASNLTAALTATSATDTSKSSSVQIAVPAISVQVLPTSVLMPVNATQQFTGNVNYDPAGKGVTWAPVQGGASCAPVCGTFSPTSTDSGVETTYTAPAAVPTAAEVDLTATSISDTTKSGIATITLTNGTVKLVPAKLEYGHVKYRDLRTHKLLSKTLLLTLANVGSSALNISGMVTTVHFAQTNDCGVSVAAGISCTVTVKFTPARSVLSLGRSRSATAAQTARRLCRCLVKVWQDLGPRCPRLSPPNRTGSLRRLRLARTESARRSHISWTRRANPVCRKRNQARIDGAVLVSIRGYKPLRAADYTSPSGLELLLTAMERRCLR